MAHALELADSGNFHVAHMEWEWKLVDYYPLLKRDSSVHRGIHIFYVCVLFVYRSVRVRHAIISGTSAHVKLTLCHIATSSLASYMLTDSTETEIGVFTTEEANEAI